MRCQALQKTALWAYDVRASQAQEPHNSITQDDSKYCQIRRSRTIICYAEPPIAKQHIPRSKMSNQGDQFPQGGDLSDMAATGTSVSGDAAKPNYIPSKAKPGQGISSEDDSNDLGAPDLAGAADNMNDMPRVRPSPSGL